MKSETVTVSKRGYIVLPAHIRKEMNIKPGSKVLIHKEKSRLTLETVPSFTQKLAGLTQKTIGDTPESVDAFLDASRKEREND
ncbi:MAG: AbrB/MazE/SpoVT family DNA-binding domain-containing protein [Desulfobacterales bacterium]|nr:AbrB/MazE/SpoVT family DNA-binding domain-containing protein [Desulfobacterales bacterium]